MNIARQEYNAIKQDIHKTGHSFADIHLEFEYEATKLLNRVRQAIKEDQENTHPYAIKEA